MRSILISAAAVALVAGAAPACAQHMAHAMAPEGTVLTVVADGSSTRTPDLAIIRAGVVTQAPTAAEAMRQNGAQMGRVIAALRAAGIAERDIQTASINLSPQYKYGEGQPPEITGYQARNAITIRFRDIGKSGAILDALVGVGANDISGPNLTLDAPEGARDEARVAAVKKARARAELYAGAAGLSVDRILSISEGGEMPGPQPVAYARAEMAAADTTEILPGEQKVTVTVTVRFLLK